MTSLHFFTGVNRVLESTMAGNGKYGKGDFREGGVRGGHACTYLILSLMGCIAAATDFEVIAPCVLERACSHANGRARAQISSGKT